MAIHKYVVNMNGEPKKEEPKEEEKEKTDKE